jgi:hypothetical protein
MSAGWADAVASAPSVASAKIATKATVLLRRPAIKILTFDDVAWPRDNSRQNIAKSSSRHINLKNQALSAA